MEQPPDILVRDDVVLRRWRADDVDTVYRLVSQSLEHLLPWMPWAARHSYDESLAFVQCSEREWQAGDAYNYVITTGGTPVGSSGLMRRIGSGGLEIGYWLHPSFTGRGLATMSAQALAQAAFDLPDITRVEIHHDVANTASAAVPRRLGYTRYAVVTEPDGPRAPGERGETVVWVLPRPQTSAGQPG